MARNSRTFLDANILIEIVDRRKRIDDAVRLIRKLGGHSFISALTAHLVLYFGSKGTSLKILEQFLADYKILSLEQADFDWAFANIRNTDFEDALQLAVAVRNGCDEFITFDEVLYKTYNNLSSIQISLLP